MIAPGPRTDTPTATRLSSSVSETGTVGQAGFDGILVLGAPESGCGAVGSWLESSGYHPVNTCEGFLIEAPVGSPVEPPTLISTEWAEFLLSMADGSWELPPLSATVLAERASLIEAFQQRLRDAADCAHGMPLVLSDENLVPILPAIGQATLSRYLGVFLLRNPLAIARSLSERYDIAIGEGLFLWEHYAATVFAAAHDIPVVVVNIDDSGHAPGLSAEAIETIVSPSQVAERLLGYKSPSPDLAPGLDGFGATNDEFLEIATRHQIEMWSVLTDTASSGLQLRHYQEALERPSDRAVEVLHDGARHRTGRVSKLEFLRVINEGRASYDALSAESEERLSSARASLAEALLERDQLREAVTDLMQRLRTMGVTQAEGHRKAERLSKELEELNARQAELVKDSEELHKVYASESWRVGYTLTTPVRRIKEIVFGTGKGTEE